ncbi:MAG: hypothetical protein WBA63_05515 [Thermomicrobiales bacterium]
MRYLRITSWAITLAGLLTIAAAMLAGLSVVWLLAGIMLTWAGVVKIAVVLIWERVARLGTSEHRPTPAP